MRGFDDDTRSRVPAGAARAGTTDDPSASSPERGVSCGGSPARLLCGLLIVCCLHIFADGASGEEKKTDREATVITSRSLTADNKAKTALFEGSVVARRGNMTFSGDRMLVHYSEEKGNGNITKIEAEGSVRLVTGDRVITARAATYFAGPEEKAVFTGDPRASDGENIITGTKMTYFLKEDRSVVENSKVFLVDRDVKPGSGVRPPGAPGSSR